CAKVRGRRQESQAEKGIAQNVAEARWVARPVPVCFASRCVMTAARSPCSQWLVAFIGCGIALPSSLAAIIKTASEESAAKVPLRKTVRAKFIALPRRDAFQWKRCCRACCSNVAECKRLGTPGTCVATIIRDQYGAGSH